MKSEAKLNEEERVYLYLKALFESFGYGHYRMRKFEEYSLYSENRNFLQSGGIITFSDRDGRLLALKPDVTLSIVKNSAAAQGKRKAYYRESVYRADRGSGRYKEISQIGLEYIGCDDIYSQLEVLYLAAHSLKAVGGGYMIDLSHVGVIAGVMQNMGLRGCPEAVAECVRSKNVHDMYSVCLRCNIAEESAKKLCDLVGAAGDNFAKLGILEELFPSAETSRAAGELRQLLSALEKCSLAGAFNVDFSLINDPAYYTGVIFQGFVDKFPRAVLSGGRYDNLVKKFGAGSGGMGFALYPDELDYYYGEREEYDCDVLLLYGEGADPAAVLAAAQKYIARGLSVRADSCPPEGMRFAKVVKAGV